MDSSLNFIRGIVRPCIALLFSLATVVFIWTGTVTPEQFWTLLGVVITFYFVSRSAEKKAE